MHAEQQELSRSLQEKFSLVLPEGLSEEELLLMLEQRISSLIERNAEEFFQLMYRIDIPEKQLHEVLGKPDALQVLAKLIFDRQLDKARSRLKYKSYFENNNTDDELKW
ncbi:MAG: hypothetical protein H6551_10275 [Chitinophagales bacterium]|nr:hypothetical protein [Chitinophagaceae bacterium]MCB9065513.1 hypothetical protein [Chitinophagales bacterium]